MESGEESSPEMMDSIEVMERPPGNGGMGDVIERVSEEEEGSEWDSERSGTGIESDDDDGDYDEL